MKKININKVIKEINELNPNNTSMCLVNESFCIQQIIKEAIQIIKDNIKEC